MSAVVFAACGDDDSGGAPSADDLSGSAFTSTSVAGAELAPGAQLLVAFEDAQISITGGCNNLMAGYEIDGSTLVTTELASTMMACEQALMDQDTWVTEFVGGGPTIALDGDDLTLSDDTITIELTR